MFCFRGGFGRPFCTVSLLFFLTMGMLLAAVPACAYTEVIDQFIDGGVAALGRGGLAEIDASYEWGDFQRPFSLNTDGRYLLGSGYEYQRTARIFDGRWRGSRIHGERFWVTGGAPFSFMSGMLKGSVAAGYDDEQFRVAMVNSQESIGVWAAEKIEANNGGIFLNIADRMKVSLSLIDTDYRSSLEIPAEAELQVLESLRIGYRRSFNDTAASIAVSLSGQDAVMPFKFHEEVNELYITSSYRDLLTATIRNELGNERNHEISGIVKLPWRMYGVAGYGSRDLAFTQKFYVDGSVGGYLASDINKRIFRIGLGIKPVEGWTAEANFRHSEISVSGGGIAKSSAVLDLWPSLLIGDYNHTERASVVTDQYHFLTGYKGSKFSATVGAQYIYMKTEASLEYWRSTLLGLGSTGAGSLSLDTDRIRLLFLSVGIGYEWSNVRLTYSLGQFIPLGTRERRATEEGAAGTGKIGRAHV